MADAHNATQEFWHPPAASVQPSPELADACNRCGSEFMVAAQFCHVCGASRKEIAPEGANPWHHSLEMLRALEFHSIKSWLGLSTASLIAFLLGVGCVLCAIAVGVMYSVQTLADFQAIQLWRIEWLMGAIVAFAAAILLRRTDKIE